MPKLKNTRHERFAQAIADGKSAAEAYRLAGFKDDRRHASKLRQQSDVSRRVDELLQQERETEAKALDLAAERLSITKERVLEELARIAFANPRAVMRWAGAKSPTDGSYGGGVVLIPSEELTDEQAAIVAEVAETKDGLRLKLHSKTDALGKLGQHLGLFKQVHEHGGKDGAPIEVEHKSDAELARALVHFIHRTAAGNGEAEKEPTE